MKARVRPLELSEDRRALCISDIHGNLPLLQGLLDKVKLTPQDDLFILGDILERNAGSLATLRYVMELSKTHRVHTLMGNCDNILAAFLEERDLDEGFFEWWFGRLGGNSVLVQMARQAGLTRFTKADFPQMRRAIWDHFSEEAQFICSLPHIFVNEDYLLVHGGVPREENLEELDAYPCMKDDDFLGQGRSFRRWVVVGHWPVTLYRADIPSAKPMLLYDRHIASIDGGCSLKLDGQLNCLFLPRKPGEDFSYAAYDGFPEMTALDPQEANRDTVNIRWGRSALEVLEEGPELCRCRHLETGRVLDVLTEFLRRDEKGVHCEDSTDYRLPVEPGERLTVIRRLSDRTLCKRDGVTGWYFGRLKE